MINIDKKLFDRKKYKFKSTAFTRVKENRILEKQESVYLVRKIEDIGENFLDIGICELDLKIETQNFFKRKMEEALLDTLFLRVDRKFNIYEVLNKDLISEKLELLREISEDIDFIDINFDILKLKNYVDNDDVLNLMVCNYKFYECFFSEIYNGFFEDFRGNTQGEKNIFGILKNTVIPLKLSIEKIEEKKYIINGELDILKMGDLRLIDEFNKETGLEVNKIKIHYKNKIELGNANIIKNLKKKFVLKAGEDFLYGKEIEIEERE